MLDYLSAFCVEAYADNIYNFGLLVLAVVVGCAANLGAMSEFIARRLNAGRNQ